ncbi:hypothetical protein FJZ28_01035 [Candidatus Peregrinibacteria bacterium]|nr:hypothetical protein [Candidatus Peregrinibacteria bacterium]
MEDWERNIAIDRLGSLIPTITQNPNTTESQKLDSIGRVVQGTIDDIMDHPMRPNPLPVRPSILPPHDDVTIDRLARFQRILRNEPPKLRALTLERLEHNELRIQHEERSD